MRHELLIDRLAKHAKLRSLLNEASDLPGDDLVDSLMTEFEYVIDRYNSWNTFAGEARRKAESLLLQQPARAAERAVSPNSDQLPPLRIKPIKIELPSLDFQAAEQKQAAKRTEEEHKELLRSELEAAERLIKSEIERDWGTRNADHRARGEQLGLLRQAMQDRAAARPQKRGEEPPAIVPAPPVPAIADGDILYMHAAGLTHEPEAAEPLLVVGNVKGIDEANPVFSLRIGQIKFFISKVQSDELNVTKSGVLLLTREDSHHYRELHERILNDLRSEDVVHPFEFASVLRGKEAVVELARALNSRLRASLEAALTEKTWLLKLQTLDARVSRALAEQSHITTVQERGRDAKRPSKRSDVKTLERILQYERSIAESVHAQLTRLSASSAIASIVSMGSGMSDDWKVILGASYEIPIINRLKFFSTIQELQEEYRDAGVLFEVSGTAERCSVAAEG